MSFSPLGWIPEGMVGILHEISRHLLRRPVVGIAAAATVPDGRWLLIRRADTGTWALPGGTLEWGETLRAALPRELEEEAGVTECELGEVIGVYSEPKRDVRFHAVTVVVRCKVGLPVKAQKNRMEIAEIGLFEASEIPRPLAMGMDPMMDDALAGKVGAWE